MEQKKVVCLHEAGHEIAPDTDANAPKFSVLATRVHSVSTSRRRYAKDVLIPCQATNLTFDKRTSGHKYQLYDFTGIEGSSK